MLQVHVVMPYRRDLTASYTIDRFCNGTSFVLLDTGSTSVLAWNLLDIGPILIEFDYI